MRKSNRMGRVKVMIYPMARRQGNKGTRRQGEKDLKAFPGLLVMMLPCLFDRPGRDLWLDSVMLVPNGPFLRMANHGYQLAQDQIVSLV